MQRLKSCIIMKVPTYEIPVTTLIFLKTEGVICQSIVSMAFGSEENTAGEIADVNIVDGGSF